MLRFKCAGQFDYEFLVHLIFYSIVKQLPHSVHDLSEAIKGIQPHIYTSYPKELRNDIANGVIAFRDPEE